MSLESHQGSVRIDGKDVQVGETINGFCSNTSDKKRFGGTVTGFDVFQEVAYALVLDNGERIPFSQRPILDPM